VPATSKVRFHRGELLPALGPSVLTGSLGPCSCPSPSRGKRRGGEPVPRDGCGVACLRPGAGAAGPRLPSLTRNRDAPSFPLGGTFKAMPSACGHHMGLTAGQASALEGNVPICLTSLGGPSSLLCPLFPKCVARLPEGSARDTPVHL